LSDIWGKEEGTLFGKEKTKKKMAVSKGEKVVAEKKGEVVSAEPGLSSSRWQKLKRKKNERESWISKSGRTIT